MSDALSGRYQRSSLVIDVDKDLTYEILDKTDGKIAAPASKRMKKVSS